MLEGRASHCVSSVCKGYQHGVWMVQGQMAEALASLDMQVVYTPPKYTLQTPQLFELLTVEGGLEALTDEIRDHLGTLIRPWHPP